MTGAITDTERAAIEGLLALAYQAWNAADNSEDRGTYHVVEDDDFKALSAALDALDDLPDDQPGYTMAEAAKARWALRRLLGDESWQSMETAPKSTVDGLRVEGIYLQGFIPDDDLVDEAAMIDVIWWEPLLPNNKGGRGKWCANRYGEACEVIPTHWMPLPQPPTATSIAQRRKMDGAV